MKTWRDYFENVLIAVFLAMLVRVFIFTGYKVPSSSMLPSLYPGDFIFSYRLPFGVKIPLTDIKIAVNSPERGQIVVFSYPDQPKVSYVKRVVALAGDKLEIKKGRLIINEQEIPFRELEKSQYPESIDSSLFVMEEERATEGARRILRARQPSSSESQNFGPIIVPPGHSFLLGDNRDTSDDSRYWGTVPTEQVQGEIILVWLSLDWQRRVFEGRFPRIRWERLGLRISKNLD